MIKEHLTGCIGNLQSMPVSMSSPHCRPVAMILSEVSGRTKMTLEDLLAPVCLSVLAPKVEHEERDDDTDEELERDGRPETRSVAPKGILLPERDTGNDTAHTATRHPTACQYPRR